MRKPKKCTLWGGMYAPINDKPEPIPDTLLCFPSVNAKGETEINLVNVDAELKKRPVVMFRDVDIQTMVENGVDPKHLDISLGDYSEQSLEELGSEIAALASEMVEH